MFMEPRSCTVHVKDKRWSVLRLVAKRQTRRGQVNVAYVSGDGVREGAYR